MREITTVTKVYFFNELNEEQKQKVFENYHDINVDHDWWQSIYEDARYNFDIEIQSFDLGRGQSIKIKPINTLYNTAIKMKEKLNKDDDLIEYANEYLKSLDNEDDDEQINDDVFLDNLGSYFYSYLYNEYEYLITDEAIKETLIANEYEFTQNGKIF